MSRAKLEVVKLTTDGSGDASQDIQAPDAVLDSIHYVPDGSSPLATGADLTLVGKITGRTYYTETDMGTSAYSRHPRHKAQDEAGADVTYDGTNEIYGRMAISEPLTVTVAQGGDTKIGTFFFTFI